MPATYYYTGLLPKRRLYHILFWVAYYVFAVLISLSIHQITDGHYYLALISLVPPDVGLVYLNIYVLIPRLLFRKKFFLYLLSLLIAIFLHEALEIWLHRLYFLAGTPAFVYVKDFNVRNFSIQALNAIYLLGLTTGLKFVKDRMLQQQRLQEKERQHTETELRFLKSQLQPHFFFNTLNNLYSLTIQKSDLAPEIVLKLADLMSYMLYESGASTVSLDKEITHLENYIAIERLRFGPRLQLSFEKEGISGQVNIPPLLLFAFVENSFKHGLQQTIEPGKIEIMLALEDGHLFFSISNPVPGQSANRETNGNGIGLKNVTRRLGLLFGDRYSLDMREGAGVFRVQLKIPIS